MRKVPKAEGEKKAKNLYYLSKTRTNRKLFSPSPDRSSLVRGSRKFASPYGWLQLLQHRKFLHRANRVGSPYRYNTVNREINYNSTRIMKVPAGGTAQDRSLRINLMVCAFVGNAYGWWRCKQLHKSEFANLREQSQRLCGVPFVKDNF